MNKIFFTGDTHGNCMGEMKKFTSKKFPEGKNLDKNDWMIITGDFGFIFHNHQTKEEKYWLDWMNDKPWSWATLDGNHENFNRLNMLENVNKFNGEVHKVNDSIFHLKRGYVYNIANKSIFTFGGAKSIDKQNRIENVSWWKQEEANYHQTKRGYDNLEKVNWSVDYVVTHDAPTWVVNKIIDGVDFSYTNKVLDDIFSKLEFKYHYFGHYHIDKVIDRKHYSCYDRIYDAK